MGVFTIHANFWEKNIFLVALQKDVAGTEPDVVWTLSSTMVRYVKKTEARVSFSWKNYAFVGSVFL